MLQGSASSKSEREAAGRARAKVIQKLQALGPDPSYDHNPAAYQVAPQPPPINVTLRVEPERKKRGFKVPIEVLLVLGVLILLGGASMLKLPKKIRKAYWVHEYEDEMRREHQKRSDRRRAIMNTFQDEEEPTKGDKLKGLPKKPGTAAVGAPKSGEPDWDNRFYKPEEYKPTLDFSGKENDNETYGDDPLQKNMGFDEDVKNNPFEVKRKPDRPSIYDD